MTSLLRALAVGLAWASITSGLQAAAPPKRAADQPMFNLVQPRGVVVGTGGSPWDATQGEKTLLPESDRFYVWDSVTIRKSGKVDVTAYGFSDAFGPTKMLRRLRLAK